MKFVAILTLLKETDLYVTKNSVGSCVSNKE